MTLLKTTAYGGIGWGLTSHYVTINTPPPPPPRREPALTRGNIRPPLNKKSFPVHRPGGLKRAEWEGFFFHVFKKKNCLTPPHHCTF